MIPLQTVPPSDRRFKDGSIEQALHFQASVFAAGSSVEIEQIFDRFPQLKGDISAELAIVYHDHQLRPDDRDDSSQEALKRRYPHLAEDLERQFEFANLLNVYMPPSISGDAPTIDLHDGDRPEIDVSNCIFPKNVGRFKIDRVVGHGGMGIVFAASDTMLDRRVAIKVPRIEVQLNQQLELTLLKEAKVAAKLRHPNLVELFEIASFGSGNYLVSRWAGGGSLLAHLNKIDLPISEEAAIWFMSQILAGLDHCHRKNVTHLDLKPGNILFDDDADFAADHGFPGRPLVADFGLARVLEVDRSRTITQGVVGTPLYMSPEQIVGDNSAIGPCSDVYACGVIFQELLLGEHALSDLPIAQAMRRMQDGELPSLPKNLLVSRSTRQIIKKCVQRDPKFRYANAGEVLADIRRLQEGELIQIGRVPFRAAILHWCQRPERIELAAYTSIAFNLSLMAGFTALLLTMYFGWSAIFQGSASELAIDIFKLLLFPHGPMIGIAFWILSGKLSLHIVNLFFSLAFVLLVSMSILTGNSPLRVYQGREFTMFLTHIILLGNSAGLFGMHLIGLPAWWRERKISGQNKELAVLE